jgi:uncharacterized protein (TIGR02145 family)
MRKRYLSATLFSLLLILLSINCHKEDDPLEPVKDIEGNSYATVRIGTQVWMAENLRATMFNDGEEIPLVDDDASWLSSTNAGYCWYNNDETGYKDPYGALYNGYTISTGKLCPAGWHIPGKEDLQMLIDFTGDSTSGGGKLKEAGTDHWLSPNKGAENSTGFSALPAGIRYFEGTFTANSEFTSFWSATETGNNGAWYLSLYYGDTKVRLDSISKKYGLSVRCVQD